MQASSIKYQLYRHSWFEHDIPDCVYRITIIGKRSMKAPRHCPLGGPPPRSFGIWLLFTLPIITSALFPRVFPILKSGLSASSMLYAVNAELVFEMKTTRTVEYLKRSESVTSSLRTYESAFEKVETAHVAPAMNIPMKLALPSVHNIVRKVPVKKRTVMILGVALLKALQMTTGIRRRRSVSISTRNRAILTVKASEKIWTF